jgi:hypothetical protein
MAYTDEDVEAAQAEVADLRQQVADANAEREAAESEQANEVTMAQLNAEKAMLERQLRAAQEVGTATNEQGQPVQVPVYSEEAQVPDPVNPDADGVPESPSADDSASQSPPNRPVNPATPTVPRPSPASNAPTVNPASGEVTGGADADTTPGA